VTVAAILCSALVGFLVATVAYAEEPDAVQVADAAAVIATMGRESRDPLLLIGAARAVISTGARFKQAPAHDNPWTPEAMLRDAARLSQGDPLIEQWIGRTLGSSARWVKHGTTNETFGLSPGATRTFDYVMVGREPTGLSVMPTRPGALDADVQVFDADTGELIVEQSDPHSGRYGRSAYVRWQPAACGRFRVEVTNNSEEAGDFVIKSEPAEIDDCASLERNAPDRDYSELDSTE